MVRNQYFNLNAVRRQSQYDFKSSLLIGAATFATLFALSSGAIAQTPYSSAVAIPISKANDGPHGEKVGWPRPPRAPTGAPNILVILTDDVGFGASSTFGGVIPTPALDALALKGIRYNRFHTAAVCSSTRAALLTGRQPHNVGMGNVTNVATHFEGYNSVIPKSAGMVSETLRENGYSTAAFGKWHLTPDWELSEVGPFDRWPTNQGFEYFYGYMNANNQWAPALTENTVAVNPPASDPSYNLDNDLANHAIRWLQHHHDLAPEKPFFVYLPMGAAHAPHQAPREWIDKFKGTFDQGWDVLRTQIFARQKKMGIIPANTKLTPRPSFMPAWSSLDADQKRIYARMMEAFAGMLAYSDDQIARVMKELKDSGQLDNTLIFYIQGDNGGSAEAGTRGLFNEETLFNGYLEPTDYALKHINEIGGPKAFNHFPAQWAWATNSPFQYYKAAASHLGGVRTGLVVSWPGHLKQQGVIADQFLYVADIVPTILEAAGITQPAEVAGVKQKPLDGLSFAYTFNSNKAPDKERSQIFEVAQNVGIYSDGWWASTTPMGPAWEIYAATKAFKDRKWELYNIKNDYSQAHDLARSNPAKLNEMQQIFMQQAVRNNVLPIHGIMDGYAGRPNLNADRSHFVLHGGLTRVAESAAPRIIGRSWRIAADIVVPTGSASGVLITQGGLTGGYSLYLKNGVPTFHYNAMLDRQYIVQGTRTIAPGQHQIVADFNRDSAEPGAGGELTLSVDEITVAKGRIDHTLAHWVSVVEGLDVGEDTLTPISDDYTISTSKFNGSINQIVVDIKN